MKDNLPNSSALLTIQEAANILVVSTKTLRRWDKAGVLIPQRTSGNQRRYTKDQIGAFKKKREAPYGFPSALLDKQRTEDRGQIADKTDHRGQKTEKFLSNLFNLDYSAIRHPSSVIRLPNRGPSFLKVSIFAFCLCFLVGLSTLALLAPHDINLGNFLSSFWGRSTLRPTPESPTAIRDSGRASLARMTGGEVLQASTTDNTLFFNVNIPSKFAESSEFLKGISVSEIASLSGGIITDNADIDAGTGTLTASNVLYGATAGTGISLGTGQTPTITNTDLGSSQKIFKTIKVGSDSFSSGSNTDTLEFAAGTGISLSADTSNKKVTITGSATSGWTDDGTVVRLTTSSDNVGIGTSSPSTKLHVVGGTRITGLASCDTIDTDSNGLLSCGTDSGGGSGVSKWTEGSGILYPNNNTLDLLIGGTATTSAKFGFLNVNTGTPTATVSANSGNIATYLTGDGTLATTNRQTLTIGNSSAYNTSGNVLINSNATGRVGIGTTSPSSLLHIAGQCVTGDTLLRRRRRRRKSQAPNSKLQTNSNDLNSNDQKNLGFGIWDLGFGSDSDWEDVRIDQIQEGDEILSLDQESGKFVSRKVKGLMDMGVQEVFELITEGRLRITTTGNHPYLKLNIPQFIPFRPETTFEVDLSPRMEVMGHDTVVAIANIDYAATLRITEEEKNKFKKLYKNEPKVFAPELYAFAIVEIINRTDIKPTQLLIDKDYTSHERRIDKIISHFYPNISIRFTKVGHRSPADRAAYALSFGKKVKTGAGSNLKGFPTAELLHHDWLHGSTTHTVLMAESYQRKLELSRGKTEWVEVKYLRDGDIIATLQGWQKISNIVPKGRKQTYDIEIQGTHNFVGNKIVAHNTTFGSGTASTLIVPDISALTGTGNSVAGSGAGAALTSGTNNTFFGVNAGNAIVSTANSTLIGYQAGLVNTSAEITAIGSGALDANTSGLRNVAVGFNALGANISGTDNTAVGHGALDVNTANSNVAIGVNVLGANTGGLGNTAIGYQALDANTGGDFNVAVGNSALGANTNGDYNIAIGTNALLSNVLGIENVAIGKNALSTASSNYNTAIGSDALDINTGARHVAVGKDALGANTTASDNTALGYLAGDVITTGAGNIILGSDADPSSATANNEFVAGSALAAITNVYFGEGPLDASPLAYTINGGGGSGTNIAGAALQLAGGRATGNATGGSIIFQTSDAGASGTTLQSLTTKMTLLASGNFGIGDSGPDNLLDILSTSAAAGIAITSTGTDTDALLKFELTDNTPNFVLGVDDSDNDTFKIGTTALETSTMLTLDSRTTTSGVSALTLATGTAPTIASAATAYFNSSTFTPGTVNFSGSTQITSTGTSANNALLFNQPTINRTDAASNLTIDQASNLFINGPTIASHATVGQTETITASSALRIGAGSSVAGTRGVVTNAYGLYVDAPTGATNNYAIGVGSGQILVPAGSEVSAPAIAFIGDTNTGISNLGVIDRLLLVAGGAEIARFQSGQAWLGAASNQLTAYMLNSAVTTNTPLETLVVRVEDSNGFGEAGIGVYQTFEAEDGSGNVIAIARVESVLDDITASSRDSSLRFYTLGPNTSGTTLTEALRLDSSQNASAAGSLTLYGGARTIQTTSANTLNIGSTITGDINIGIADKTATEALCHATDDNVGRVFEEIIDCSGSPVADYAEMYPTEEGIDYGDIAVTGSKVVKIFTGDGQGKVLLEGPKKKIVKLIKSSSAYQNNVIGIVSNNYNDFSSIGHNVIDNKDNPMPVALNGRVPVKVTVENGDIAPGDFLTTSSTPGVAMKATRAGQVIGKALESFSQDGIGKITVFVNLSWHDPNVYIAADGNLNTNVLDDRRLTIEDSFLKLEDRSSTLSSSLQPQDTTFYSLSSTVTDLQDRVSLLEARINNLADTSFSASTSALLSSIIASADPSLSLRGTNEMSDEAISVITDGIAAGSSSPRNDIDIKNATISGTLAVLGRTTLTDLGVTGSINTGLLSIHGLDECTLSTTNTNTKNHEEVSGISCSRATINTLSGNLYLQNRGLGGIDILAGKVTIDTKGNMVVAGTITANKINIDTKDKEAASIGSSVLKAGERYATISSTAVTANSKIFVTATTPTGKQSLIVSDKSPDNSFTVSIEEEYSKDIEFDWWVVN